VLAVIVARDVEDLGEPDFTLDDVRDEWAEPGFSLADDAWLAERDGEIAGYAALRDNGQLVLVAPGHCGHGLGSALLDRAEQRARALGRPLRQHLAGGNRAAAELLSRAGYRRGISYWRLRMELLQPPPEPVWPEGVTVRPFAGRSDERAAFELHQRAFAEVAGDQPQTFERWRSSVVGRTIFDPTLFMLAELDGAIVGSAHSELWQDEGLGSVRRLATTGAGRGIGLGRALLLAALGEFVRRGMPAAVLDVQGDNDRALRLYRSVGMRPLWQIDRWDGESA
jgi:mycothiol synthase